MRWVKSSVLVLLSFCLCFGMLPMRQADAAISLNRYAVVVIVQSIYSNKYTAMASVNNVTFYDTTYDGHNVINSSAQMSILSHASGYNQWYDTVGDVINAINTLDSNSYGFMGYTYPYSPIIIGLKGAITYTGSSGNVFDDLTDYNDSIAPKWYENAWDTFIDYFTNPVPFQWFKNLINRVFDDDDETNISDGVNLTNPTLTPPPTPIPYSTVVIPKTDVNTGDTYYETNYIYANPSGTPIVQPYPPTSQPSGNEGGSGDNYYPVDGEPLKLPKLKWLSPVTIGDTNYDGVDSIYDGLSSVDDIGSEYTDGISAVSDATSVLPTNWLMLIGIAAAIPLFAGIISRFLS